MAALARAGDLYAAGEVAVVRFLVDHQFDGGGDDHDRDGEPGGAGHRRRTFEFARRRREQLQKAVVAGRVRYVWVPW